MSVPASHDPRVLPTGLPVPQDDGACDHLGSPPFDRWPAGLALASTSGRHMRLDRELARPVVVFVYPRTGVPGQPPALGYSGEDWDTIPGARGCTSQSCAFRDLYAEFQSLGVDVLGLSTNSTEHQREFKARNHVPYEFLSDAELMLTRALHLPTFRFPVESGGPDTLLRRMAMLIEPDEHGSGRISKVWYPVFPSDQNAATVLGWLRNRAERVAGVAAARAQGHTRLDVTIRPIEPRDLTWVRSELNRNWGATQISSLGVWYDADRLPGFVATIHDGVERVGLATHTIPDPGGRCEVITLSSCIENVGVGARLLDACTMAARNAGCERIHLTTTNDNLRAIAFYQRRGWSLIAVHAGAMDRARAIKPSIPKIGLNGLPLRDELEFEFRFRSVSGDSSSPVETSRVARP